MGRYGHLIKLIIFVLFLCGIAFFLTYDFDFLTKSRAEEINWFVFIATALLAGIAYFEFNRANKLSSNEFLLFISNRWGSAEVIKARQIIHAYFVKNYRNPESTTFSDYNCSLCQTSKNILELSRKDGEDGSNFIYLLNLIDYLETISYFYDRGDLELSDIQNTSGHNILFLYAIFQSYKEQRQKHDKTYFANIDKLYKALKTLSA
ncbi:hypothetical protein ELY21_14965 [Legionella sp. km535]|uniref:DUF4760 domain-containing protein n=1 Tax=Legionella sp. km535 TaxID=2498107 RepID=UPI000F8D14F2|nr:hypothetical protein [Legionella sp. km535]RUR15187.1 hypothetical protein ELY21_14965 [Legionella sp. km535]